MPIIINYSDLFVLAEKVNFIDYEYTAYNYEAHDIAMHFCDYAGNENYVYLMSVLTLSTANTF